MADQYSWHIGVHHVESDGMILLGDLVLDIDLLAGAHSMSSLHHCRIGTSLGVV